MNRLRNFMYGRYGSDAFSIFLTIAAMALVVAGAVTGLFALDIIAIAALVYAYYRMFSKNIYKRAAENQKFLHAVYPIRRFFSRMAVRMKDRSHKYFKCPSCSQTLRVPRGKGKIRVTCPHCRAQCTKNT